jgi:excinuclease UvrABC ATPase subunit
VHGARENNLKDLSVELPKRRLTVFTGVSGSGKSSLVFDTIAAESQRLINETYSAFVQGFMPTLARPEVDVLEGLRRRRGADPGRARDRRPARRRQARLPQPRPAAYYAVRRRAAAAQAGHPQAGHDGGRIVFKGTPADLVAARSTLTGEHLAAYVGT